MTHNGSINNFIVSPSLAVASAIFGVLIYLIQSINYAHTQISLLDEGAYLYKGYLFATGRYIPFQDYGPYVNHMPLSFLIPGYIQAWFGPGLRTGRYLSIALGLLFLLGLWIVSYRLGGAWWAAGAVWATALNPMYSRVYSLAVPQALVICMLIWIMVLVLDERASLWWIGLGSALAGFLLLVRLNMIFVLPLLIVYIFWQHGTRAGLLATFIGSSTIVVGHALFWPGIMRLWAFWLPASITPFLNGWRGENLGKDFWNPKILVERRWLSFWFGMRFNFISMVGLLGFGSLGLRKKSWKSAFHQRTAFFLSSLVLLMVAAHAWASLWQNYCVFCFPSYLTYFTPLIFPLIIITFAAWESRRVKWYAIFASLLILLISAGIGYGSYQDLGQQLLELPVPRVKSGHLVGGTAPLWGVLEGALGLDYKTVKIFMPILVGLIAGILLILISWGIYRSSWIRVKSRMSYGQFTLSIFLAIGLILSPTILLGNGYQENDCNSDVIAAHESAGRHLAKVVPEGAQVYWDGGLTVVPLLYAWGANVYLPQINGSYTFRNGGDAEELLKRGLWNSYLAKKWKQEANYIIVKDSNYSAGWRDLLETVQFEELQISPRTTPCRNDTRLRIFRRIYQ